MGNDLKVTSTRAAGNVLEWSARKAPAGFEACRDLHAYWEALRGDKLVPARADFDPRGIEKTLACTFVAERVAPSVARIRVAGTVLNEALGMDVRGMPITAFFEPASREILSEATRTLFTDPSMLVLELTARRGLARKPVQARMLLLPMSDAQGEITRLVGCLDIDGAQAATPRRFKVASLRSAELTGTAPQPAEPRIPFAKAAPAPAPASSERFAFAEAPVPFRSARRAAKIEMPQKGLRLVVDNG